MINNRKTNSVTLTYIHTSILYSLFTVFEIKRNMLVGIVQLAFGETGYLDNMNIILFTVVC